MLASCVWLITGCASFQSIDRPAQFTIDQLIDPSGQSLYTFDRDAAYSGKSLCDGRCEELWRPVPAAPGSRRIDDFAIITRADGTRQWAYRGKPLYRYAKDRKPSDAFGAGIDNLWRLAMRESR